MLHLTLRRRIYTPECTIGMLMLGGNVFCYTLEDTVRKPGEAKVPGKTAIPAGYYRGRTTMSEKFKLVLPILLNVEGFDGIRIHSGNDADDTRGCILVGQTTDWKGRVGGSRAAMGELMTELAKHNGLFDIEVNDGPIQG